MDTRSAAANPHDSWVRRKLLRIAGSIAIIGAITALDHILPHLNHTTITLTFLMGVLGIAAGWGLLEAVVASAATIACEAYFFLAPIYDFRIEDSQNWVAVAAFFIVSVVASSLSTSARNKAAEAIERQRELELLYELSQSLIAATGDEPEQFVVDQTRQVFGFECCVLRITAQGRVYRSGNPNIEVPPQDIIPVEAGGDTYGEIGWFGPPLSPQAAQSIAHMAAVALNHARTQQAATRAEAARQGQELKSLLLDAIAHEFKTPLTSIKFGATVLRDDRSLKPGQRELVTVIEEETDRLNGMISEAIQMARIEGGNVQLQRGGVSASLVVTRALERLQSPWQDRQFDIRIPEDLPLIDVDAALVAIALAHLIDNACKYSPADTSVHIEASLAGTTVRISVCDRGPGIPEGDRERIFERFYRRAQHAKVPGSGTGLTIAGEIARVHSGALTVDNRPGGGSCFHLSLPIVQSEAPSE